MRAIRKINNNAAICLDDNANEVVVIGKGVGFPKLPYDIEDLSIVEMTYYKVDHQYIDLLNQIPEEYFEISEKIVQEVRGRSNTAVSSNLVFTLADHICFAVERSKKGMTFNNPLHYDIQHFYEEEYEIGKKAVRYINHRLKVHLPKEEESNIALHIINSKVMSYDQQKTSQNEETIRDIVDIISEHFNIYIDRNSFDYSRFVSHMQYLLKKGNNRTYAFKEEDNFYKTVFQEYPQITECSLKIKDYLEKNYSMKLKDEDLLYLVLHIHRLCKKSDQERKGTE